MPKKNHSKHKRHASKKPPTLLIMAGIALILVAVFAFKNSDNSAPSSASLEAQLDQALNEGRPTFVFLHSLDCIPCKAMMKTVADVYPKYEESVVLIDVNIYNVNCWSTTMRMRKWMFGMRPRASSALT